MGDVKPYSEAGSSSPEDSGAFSPAELPLQGSVERIVHFHEDTGHCLLDLKVDGRKDHVFFEGHVPTVYPGQNLEAALKAPLDPGSFVRSASRIRLSWPRNERTLKKFLKSGALPGLNPALATLLAKSFPPKELLGILETSSSQLLDVSGIGPKKRQ